MKLTINKPQNAYAGWTGFLTDTEGKRHKVAAWNGQASYDTRDQLIKAAKRKMKEIEAVAARRAVVLEKIANGVTGPL